MLQFSATLYTATARLAPRSSWRFTTLIANNLSTAATNEASITSTKEDDSTKFSEVEKNMQSKEKKKSKKTVSQIIFDSTANKLISENDAFTKQFRNAKSINELLDLATLPNLSVNNALKLISSITNEINSGKSQVGNVETDKRFINLRKMVKVNDQTGTNANTSSNDLSQYSQLSTPAMINLMSSLREQGNRNLSLLRMLSYNIVKYNNALNLKQCATLLYSMAILNFPDKILLEKITADLLECIPKSTKTVTNTSIITSLGFLHYKNEDILDVFCDTLLVESMKYRLRDYLSILQTFAVLQYRSNTAMPLIEKLVQHVESCKISGIEWLDLVWALSILGVAQPRHVQSVLEPAFIKELNASSELSISKKLKLLNINGVAQFTLENYKGSLLDENPEIFKDLSLIMSKKKQTYIDALSETLKKLLSSSSYFKTNIDTNMGFLLDAEYCLDDVCKPIPVENWNVQSNSVRRIAIMIHDYHDYCRGQNDLIGPSYLYTQLLKAKGYDLITISHENFSIQDKIEKRISYLKECMKSVEGKRSI